jgi:hypothetical protein
MWAKKERQLLNFNKHKLNFLKEFQEGLSLLNFTRQFLKWRELLRFQEVSRFVFGKNLFGIENHRCPRKENHKEF